MGRNEFSSSLKRELEIISSARRKSSAPKSRAKELIRIAKNFYGGLIDAGDQIMVLVNEIILSDNAERSSVIIGGGSVKLNAWPTNPDGERLVLVASIECANLKKTFWLQLNPRERCTVYLFNLQSL